MTVVIPGHLLQGAGSLSCEDIKQATKFCVRYVGGVQIKVRSNLASTEYKCKVSKSQRPTIILAIRPGQMISEGVCTRRDIRVGQRSGIKRDSLVVQC